MLLFVGSYGNAMATWYERVTPPLVTVFPEDSITVVLVHVSALWCVCVCVCEREREGY